MTLPLVRPCRTGRSGTPESTSGSKEQTHGRDEERDRRDGKGRCDGPVVPVPGCPRSHGRSPGKDSRGVGWDTGGRTEPDRTGRGRKVTTTCRSKRKNQGRTGETDKTETRSRGRRTQTRSKKETPEVRVGVPRLGPERVAGVGWTVDVGTKVEKIDTFGVGSDCKLSVSRRFPKKTGESGVTESEEGTFKGPHPLRLRLEAP